MQNSNLNRSRSLRVRYSAALWAILAMGLGAMARPGQALAWTGQPLAYVTSSDGISVIDTGENKVVDTILDPAFPAAVTPDGKHIYTFGPNTSDLVFNISVIDATDDKVMATVPLDVALVQSGVELNENSSAIAVTPDGKHVYVTTGLCSSNDRDCSPRPENVYYALWVIDTATNKVVAASPGKGYVQGIAFSPDGEHTYFATYDSDVLLPQVLVFDTGNSISLPPFGTVNAIAITPDGRHLYVPYVMFNGTVSPPEIVAIVDTVTNTVAQIVQVETTPFGATLTGIAVTPDGKYVYVSNQASNSVAVIDTASNTIVKTVLVGMSPAGVAVTPDGVHVYVSNPASNSVSVINTASNTVVDTISVAGPGAISIIPPPQGVPFLSFNAKLDINLGPKPIPDTFDLRSSLILSGTANNEISLGNEPVKLQVGPFIATIPAGSFRRHEDRSYTFEGVIDGARLEAKIELTGSLRYTFRAQAKGANLSGITNPVQVSLGIGNNAGLTTVKAHFDGNRYASLRVNCLKPPHP
jgi:YVTN family beta-propeller protein